MSAVQLVAATVAAVADLRQVHFHVTPRAMQSQRGDVQLVARGVGWTQLIQLLETGATAIFTERSVT